MASSSVLLAGLIGAVAGMIVGSFLATVVVRAGEGRSALHGRSACDGCGRRLRARHLVPLVSWLMQRGRCGHCGARIDPAHPLVELAAGLIGAIALLVRPDLVGVAGALFGWALLLPAALDVRQFWLPDAITLPLLAGGIAAAALLNLPLPDRIVGAVAGFLLLEAVRRTYARARGREGMGGGDPKLLAAIGAWLGWQALPGVILAASLLGLGLALVARLAGREIGATTALPFGALLAPAGFLAWTLINLR